MSLTPEQVRMIDRQVRRWWWEDWWFLIMFACGMIGMGILFSWLELSGRHGIIVVIGGVFAMMALIGKIVLLRLRKR